MRIQYSEGIILIGLMVGNIRHWPAKTFEWRGVTRDLRKRGPIEMLTTCAIAKLMKIRVLWHQFSNLTFNLHYMLTPPFFSSTHLLSFFGFAPDVGQTYDDHDKGFFNR